MMKFIVLSGTGKEKYRPAQTERTDTNAGYVRLIAEEMTLNRKIEQWFLTEILGMRTNS